MQPATFDKCNLQPVIELSERLLHKLQISSGNFYRRSPGDCFCYFALVRMVKENYSEILARENFYFITKNRLTKTTYPRALKNHKTSEEEESSFLKHFCIALSHSA